MQQHPVPQNVTSYQFRLIGDMTLTQFFQLLAGGVLAYVFYSTNLINIVKYLLMFISVITGVAFAFLPLEGRPLSQWTMAFIRAIYMPTQFYWQKNPKLPDYLSDELMVKSPPIQNPTPNTPPPQVNEIAPETRLLEEHRSKRLDEIMSLYDQVEIPKIKPQTTPTKKPVATAKPISASQISSTHQITPVEMVEIKPASKPQPKTSPEPTVVNQPINQNIIQNNAPRAVFEDKSSPSTLAVFNPSLPFPSLPQTKNTLVGMVFDKSGNSIEGAVIEINNSLGTVRATKTNRLGQFFLATPLENNNYTLEVEKQGFSFRPISLVLEDKVYPPLEIRAVN